MHSRSPNQFSSQFVCSTVLFVNTMCHSKWQPCVRSCPKMTEVAKSRQTYQCGHRAMAKFRQSQIMTQVIRDMGATTPTCIISHPQLLSTNCLLDFFLQSSVQCFILPTYVASWLKLTKRSSAVEFPAS